MLAKARIFLLLFFLGLTSCSKQKTFDSEKEFWEYLNNPDNEYKQLKSVNNIDFSLLYKPTDALVSQELGGKTSDSLVSILRKRYSKHLYFTLSMSSNNKELLSGLANNRQKFGAMVNQLSFMMNEKVHVFTKSKDTLALQDYVYPRMYGMTTSTRMLFIYERNEKHLKESYLNLTIQDLGFQTGNIKFKIPTEIIKHQPVLLFK